MFVPKFPLHVVFILGHKCNLSCTHCSSSAGKNLSLGYSTEKAEDILRQIADVGMVDVAFSGGEPLLRRDLEHLVAYAKSLGLTVGTSTNGYALNEKRARGLKSAGLDRLQISLDGLEHVHDSIRGQGSFIKAVEAIETSIATGLKTHVCFTAMDSNVHQFRALLSMVDDLGVDGFNLSQFVPTGRGKNEECLSPTDAKTLLETWLTEKESRAHLYMSAHSSGLAALDPAADHCRGGCQAGMSISCIMPNGDVTPCVMFPLKIGNINTSTLRSVWHESPIIRTLQARDLKGGCGDCIHRDSCGGCRASAWAISGDIMAEDPGCWLNQ